MDHEIVNSVAPSEDEFQSLIAAASQGNERAMLKLCSYYEPIVRVTARMKLGPALRPHFDSIDLVQSVHRSLLIGLKNQKFDISSPNKLVALANAMIHRKIGRKWRKASRQLRLSGTSPDDTSIQQSLELLLASNDQNMVELRDQIARLCDLLTGEERRMLELRLAGFNATEVAEQMNAHPIAIRVRWTRLRKRLEGFGITPDWFD